MKTSLRALFAFASLVVFGAAANAQQETPTVSLPGAYDQGFLLFRSADSSFAYWLDGRVQIDGAGPVFCPIQRWRRR